MLQTTETPIAKPQQPKNATSFTLANLLVVLSIPALALLAIWGGERLVDPLFSVSVIENIPRYPSLPRTIEQIKAELGQSGLSLGDRLDLGDNFLLYAILEQDQQGISELRVYQQIPDQKLVLHKILPIRGLDELTVRSPLKDDTNNTNPNTRRRWRRLPLQSIQKIAPIPNSPPGQWFAITGTNDGIRYGQVVQYQSLPRPQLRSFAEWSSPAGSLPRWQNFLNLPLMQLVIDQTQNRDAQFQVFIWETDTKPQLRPVYLPQPLGIRRLAEVGLWSLAQAKFDNLRAERTTAGKALTPLESEQYALIARHAEIMQAQLDRLPPLTPSAEPAAVQEQVYLRLLAGEWHTALDLLDRQRQVDRAIIAMLKDRHPHLWQRITASLQVAANPDRQGLKAWGALIQLSRSGLRSAETWLAQNQAQTLANLALLQRFDLAPVGISPQILVGRATPIGTQLPDGDWLLPPPLLADRQIWFTVDIDIIADRAAWLSSPFPPLSDRARLLIWQVLGLARQPQLSLTTASTRRVFSLTAHSYSITPSGALQILATGDQTIAEFLAQEPSNHQAIVIHGTLPQMASNLAIPLSLIPRDMRQVMVSNLYAEVQTLGGVDASIEQLHELARRWQFYSFDINGDGKQEFLLPLERQQINMGDRPYPAVIVFDQTGQVLFSDIDLRLGKRWIATLKRDSQTMIPLLIEEAGRFQLWQLP